MCINQFITATKPNNFRIFPYELQENQALTMSCSANVGAPKGNIQIWKVARNSNKNVLIFTENTSDFKTENCSEFINATFTYTVSRDDNGALFLCSSQNVLNNEAGGPSLESQIYVSVKCKLKSCLYAAPVSCTRYQFNSNVSFKNTTQVWASIVRYMLFSLGLYI